MDTLITEKPVEEQSQPQINSPQTSQKNVLMAVFSYLGPLIIISYLTAKEDSFVKFHIRQGAVLFGIEIALMILTSMFYPLMMLSWLINLGILILSIIGIVNAVKGKEEELPLVGHLAVHIPL